MVSSADTVLFSNYYEWKNFQKCLLTFGNKHRKPYWKEANSMTARERWLRGYTSLVEREPSD